MVTNVAVLDDYQSFAPPHFDKLDANFAVTYIPDTLLPYNHPNTPQTVKDEIVKRLEPFDVICELPPPLRRDTRKCSARSSPFQPRCGNAHPSQPIS